MAQIKEYTNTENIRPTETGIEATASAARRIGSNYAEAGAAIADMGNRIASTVKDVGDVAVDFATHREVSHGAVAFAAKTDDLINRWNDTAKNADPNDPTVAAKFRAEVAEPELEKLRAGFLTEGGQKFADAHINALRTHLYEKTSADMSSAAAAAVKTNIRNLANMSSNTAMKDPSSVPFLLSSVDGSVGAIINSSPNLKGVAAANARTELTEMMKEKLVKAGAIGAVQTSANPEKTAAEWGSKYPQYINGEELKMLSANARQQIRAARIDQAYAEHIKEKGEQQKSDATEVALLKDLYSDDPKRAAAVTTKSVVNNDDLKRPAKKRMIDLVNRELKPETDAKISAETFSDLAQGIRSGEITDLDPIFKARSTGPGEPGSITRADAQELRQMFADMQTPEGSKLGRRTHDFVTAVAPQIDKSNPLMGVIDRTGKQQTYEFNQFVESKIAEYRKDKKNVYDLFTPGKPDYLGRPEVLRQYQKPLDASIRSVAETFAPPATKTVDPTNPPFPGFVWDAKVNGWRGMINGKPGVWRD